MQHLNDTKFFWDAIEAFSFDYDFYTNSGRKVDSLGHIRKMYTKKTIRGSLQSSQGYKKSKSVEGATVSATFNFYCKSLYKFDVDDFIKTPQGQWLICIAVTEPYDEYGVRAGTFEMTDLYHHKELLDYINYSEGNKPV